jgi:hypothetical protein
VTAAAPGEHVVVLHRWRDSAALYQGYLDHLAVDVSYLVPPAAAGSVPRSAAGVEVVERMDDLIALANGAARLRRRVGPPTRIVALAAADLDAAAELRVLLGCAGETPVNRATLRDRYAMLSAVTAAGIPVPRYTVVSQSSDVLRLLAEQPDPLVLTPRFGSAEAAQVVIETPDDAENLGGMLAEPMLARTHRPAARYAIDGVWDGSRLLCWRAARYLSSDSGSAADWLGSVELATGRDTDPATGRDTDPATGRDTEPATGLPERLAEFAAAALGVLVARPAAVHVTVAVRDRPGQPPELSFDWASTGFLGSELPLLWQEVHGIDLAGAAIAGQLGRPLPRLSERRPMLPEPPGGLAGLGGTGQLGGWAQVFLPVPAPCRVTAVDFHFGELAPYASMLPRVGERIPAGERVAASLRFRADDTAELERAVRAAADGIRLTCSRL